MNRFLTTIVIFFCVSLAGTAPRAAELDLTNANRTEWLEFLLQSGSPQSQVLDYVETGDVTGDEFDKHREFEKRKKELIVVFESSKNNAKTGFVLKKIPIEKLNAYNFERNTFSICIPTGFSDSVTFSTEPKLDIIIGVVMPGNLSKIDLSCNSKGAGTIQGKIAYQINTVLELFMPSPEVAERFKEKINSKKLFLSISCPTASSSDIDTYTGDVRVNCSPSQFQIQNEEAVPVYTYNIDLINKNNKNNISYDYNSALLGLTPQQKENSEEQPQEKEKIENAPDADSSEIAPLEKTAPQDSPNETARKSAVWHTSKVSGEKTVYFVLETRQCLEIVGQNLPEGQNLEIYKWTSKSTFDLHPIEGGRIIISGPLPRFDIGYSEDSTIVPISFRIWIAEGNSCE